MKILHLILLVAVALEAGLSVWSVAAAEGETVIVKPAPKKGKSPKKIRRTIRVRESPPPPSPSAAPQIASPAQPLQPAAPVPAPAQQISNEVHISPDISVQVSPQQHQHHQPQPQQLQPVVQVQAPLAPVPQPIVAEDKKQEPIVELPDDDDDDDDDDKKADDNAGDEHEVKAENMQIVPYQSPEPSSVPVVEQEEPQLQIVPHVDPILNRLVEVGDNQVEKLLLTSSDLLEQPESENNTEIVPIGGAELTDSNDDNNNKPNLANIIDRRYTPLGWPLNPTVPAFPYQANQVPLFQVSSNEQVRRPWLSMAPAMVQAPQQVPYAAVAPLSPYVAASVGAPLWQQPAASFYPAPTVGAALPATNLYQPAVYPAGPLLEAPRFGGYYNGLAALSQPLVQQPAMMMAPAMVQQQPIMVQPVLMHPADIRFRRNKKQKKEPKEQQVVVEPEEPAAPKIVEVKPKVEEPEEIEWETVRIPKDKKKAFIASQQQLLP